jgi:hypothetical protein
MGDGADVTAPQVQTFDGAGEARLGFGGPRSACIGPSTPLATPVPVRRLPAKAAPRTTATLRFAG